MLSTPSSIIGNIISITRTLSSIISTLSSIIGNIKCVSVPLSALPVSGGTAALRCCDELRRADTGNALLGSEHGTDNAVK
jgi:hypothetical protein